MLRVGRDIQEDASRGTVELVRSAAGEATHVAPVDLRDRLLRRRLERHSRRAQRPFLVTKFAWPHLVRSGAGVVLDVASVAGSIAGQVPPMVAHCAANAGVVGMTRRLALEGAPHGIRAVSISPGPVSTPASERDLGDDQAARDAVTGKTLLKRFARPEEIVELAAFLASDRAAYITGTDYLVDGGAAAW
ncbi:SDR family NAD(P)-dependent oxidoreductase [Streptomyces spinosus]|uniref:SDR family NAD(P)-dependent oxidoreductase n=1 Tax=Streptomyces spinosus TaxID=2872623 RepID=UPI001CEDF869|nr:SDR family oxidoreductase [Streptomyces spinosus]